MLCFNVFNETFEAKDIQTELLKILTKLTNSVRAYSSNRSQNLR